MAPSAGAGSDSWPAPATTRSLASWPRAGLVQEQQVVLHLTFLQLAPTLVDGGGADVEADAERQCGQSRQLGYGRRDDRDGGLGGGANVSCQQLTTQQGRGATLPGDVPELLECRRDSLLVCVADPALEILVERHRFELGPHLRDRPAEADQLGTQRLASFENRTHRRIGKGVQAADEARRNGGPGRTIEARPRRPSLTDHRRQQAVRGAAAHRGGGA